MKCTDYINTVTNSFHPKIALVLDSGLGEFADSIKKIAEISYADFESFPVSGVGGQAKRGSAAEQGPSFKWVV